MQITTQVMKLCIEMVSVSWTHVVLNTVWLSEQQVELDVGLYHWETHTFILFWQHFFTVGCDPKIETNAFKSIYHKYSCAALSESDKFILPK